MPLKAPPPKAKPKADPSPPPPKASATEEDSGGSFSQVQYSYRFCAKLWNIYSKDGFLEEV